MLVSMNAMRTYEMVSFYAKTNNKFMLVIDNTRWCFLDSTKQQEVMAYYDEIIISAAVETVDACASAPCLNGATCAQLQDCTCDVPSSEAQACAALAKCR